MVDRQEVEDLPREVVQTILDMATDGGPVPVPAPIAAALCRAWLAVDEAASGAVEAVGDDEAGQPRVLIHSTRNELMRGPSLAGQRVRIVKEGE